MINRRGFSRKDQRLGSSKHEDVKRAFACIEKPDSVGQNPSRGTRQVVSVVPTTCNKLALRRNQLRLGDFSRYSGLSCSCLNCLRDAGDSGARKGPQATNQNQGPHTCRMHKALQWTISALLSNFLFDRRRESARELASALSYLLSRVN